jgi:hypothetical protein
MLPVVGCWLLVVLVVGLPILLLISVNFFDILFGVLCVCVKIKSTGTGIRYSFNAPRVRHQERSLVTVAYY